MSDAQLPRIIQGGMGVGVSSWRLAGAVSRSGQLGVVSGTALDVTLARRLQDGDAGGHVRRALDAFPDPAMAGRVLDRYYLPDGRRPGAPYLPVPKPALRQGVKGQELAVVGNFVEVWLAKQGHDGVIGINYLEKIQMATPAAALGAMVAGVDYVLMGAGVPREIPRLLDDLAAGRAGHLGVEVHGLERPHQARVNPRALLGDLLPPLRRPRFLAIVSAAVLATYLARDEATRPDGFVVEGYLAGGHNAPPRGKLTLDADGEPVYGDRDLVDVAKIVPLGLPFWLAGGYGTPEGLDAALAVGAAGVQVGTLFALADESGLRFDLRDRLRDGLTTDAVRVRTDVRASPTGFPFKVAELAGTVSDPEVYAARERLCDLGYLRTPYVADSGRVGYRCPGEPVDTYVSKGGDRADAAGRACLCNALTADIGLGQTRPDGYQEPALVTVGSDLTGARTLAELHPRGWTASDAVAFLST
jgi:NAD(P)H-dependent flavin oxidoreductase YrpB (nitropropane dioxygenase family)